MSDKAPEITPLQDRLRLYAKMYRKSPEPLWGDINWPALFIESADRIQALVERCHKLAAKNAALQGTANCVCRFDENGEPTEHMCAHHKALVDEVERLKGLGNVRMVELPETKWDWDD